MALAALYMFVFRLLLNFMHLLSVSEGNEFFKRSFQHCCWRERCQTLYRRPRAEVHPGLGGAVAQDLGPLAEQLRPAGPHP